MTLKAAPEVLFEVTLMALLPDRLPVPVHVPDPVAAIVVEENWQAVRSGPALGLDVTKILMVSTQVVSETHR